MDEMWSFVQKKKSQYWLWHAIDHKTGAILAYVFGRRKHVVLKKLLKLLKPYKIHKVYADGNYAYGKYIGHDKVNVGKRNTQKIERIHLSLRTWVKRLARKTICFSKTHKMHEIVVGLCILCVFWLQIVLTYQFRTLPKNLIRPVPKPLLRQVCSYKSTYFAVI